MTNLEVDRESELIKKLKRSKADIKEINSYIEKYKVNLDLLDQHGYNSFHYAIKSENPDMVNLFLTCDFPLTVAANPDTETKDTKKDIYLHPLHYTLLEVNDNSALSKIIKILIRNNSNVKSLDEYGCNVLHRAAEKGNIELLEYILNKEPSLINTTSKYGGILHLAIQGDQEDLIEFALNNTTVDLDLRDSSGNNVLHTALLLKNFNIFKLLYDFIVGNKDYSSEMKRKLFNGQNEDGNTILHELAFSKSSVLLNLVLKMDSEYRTDPDAKNKQGLTYKDVQDDIIRITKEKEKLDKERKELMIQEKLRIYEEKRKIKEDLKKEEELLEERARKEKEIGDFFLNHRGKIFILFGALLMAILFFALNNASTKKKVLIL